MSWKRLLANNIAGGINVSATTSYSWVIDVPDEPVEEDGYVLRFIPLDGDCDEQGQEVTSGFFFIEAAQPTSSHRDAISSSATSTSTTSTSTTSSSTTSSSTTSSSTTSSSLPPSTSTTSSSPSSATQPNTATAPAVYERPPSSSGLSTGAKAGIGGGIGAALILLVAALAFFLKAKRSRRHAQNWFGQRTNPEKEVTAHHLGPYQDAPNQDFDWNAAQDGIGPVKDPARASAVPRPHELDGSHLISELNGERRN